MLLKTAAAIPERGPFSVPDSSWTAGLSVAAIPRSSKKRCRKPLRVSPCRSYETFSTEKGIGAASACTANSARAATTHNPLTTYLSNRYDGYVTAQFLKCKHWQLEILRLRDLAEVSSYIHGTQHHHPAEDRAD